MSNYGATRGRNNSRRRRNTIPPQVPMTAVVADEKLFQPLCFQKLLQISVRCVLNVIVAIISRMGALLL